MTITVTPIEVTPNSALYQIDDAGTAVAGLGSWVNGSAPRSCKHVVYAPELNLWVAVGLNGVMTSPDGFNWTNQVEAEDNFWRSVCWSSDLGLFVACSDGGVGSNRFMSSPDGITWTARTHDLAGGSHKSVVWSPALGLFCATGFSGNIQTSPDGINWTKRTSPEANSWGGVCWSPDDAQFVAVGYGGTFYAITSPDGINWTGRAAVANTYNRVAYGNGIYVAVGIGGDIMRSVDGINWTLGTAFENVNFLDVAYSPELDLFVAAANSGTNRIQSSRDGTTWASESTLAVTPDGIAWSSELLMFIAVPSLITARALGADETQDQNVLPDLATQRGNPGGCSLADVLDFDGGYADQNAARAAFISGVDVLVHLRESSAPGVELRVDQNVSAPSTPGNFRLELVTAKRNLLDTATFLLRLNKRHSANG